MSGRRETFRVPAGPDDGRLRRYRLTIAYDGTAYSGWQVQPHRRSIQGEVETALAGLAGAAARVHASGRTDAGVHARAQVAHVDLPRPFDPARLQAGLNALLDEDIRVLSVRRAAADFHARFDAVGKEYRYLIHNAPVMPPDVRLRRLHVPRPLDVEAMRRAAGALVGRHDFAAFAAYPNREIDGTVRRLARLAVLRKGACVTLVAEGDGFLYKMVRSLAGFLLRVGTGGTGWEDAARILASRTRTARVPTAPPRGLVLWRVRYAPGGAGRPG